MHLRILRQYKQYHNLYRIDESLRILKTTMQTRPIYLRTAKHIEGHFIICFFAFMLERELEFRLRRRKIKYSARTIKEALNSMEFSYIEVENKNYYLKSKNDELASKIFSILRIKQLKNLLTEEQALDYVRS